MKKSLLLFSALPLYSTLALSFNHSNEVVNSPSQCHIDVKKDKAFLGLGDGEDATEIEINISASGDFNVEYLFDFSELVKVDQSTIDENDIEIRFREQDFHSQFSNGVWLPLSRVIGKQKAKLTSAEAQSMHIQLRLLGTVSDWKAGSQIIRFEIKIDC